MRLRREWRSSGPFARSLHPCGRLVLRAFCSACHGADQSGISAKVAVPRGGFGQAIHIVDEFALLQRLRRFATLFATLKNEGRFFKYLLQKGNSETCNAATPATGSRARIESLFACLPSWRFRMLYARVGRCRCCTVAIIINRYIYQILKIFSLQHRRFFDCCSCCRTIKYPEISTSYLSGGLNG